MSRVNLIRRTFNSGELSPRLEDRADVPKVLAGLRRAENVIITQEGGASRRPGLRYIGETRYSGHVARLLSFQFSYEQAYIIEAADYTFRFFHNGERVGEGGVPYEVATPYAIESVGLLSTTQSGDVLFIAHPAHPPRMLIRHGPLSWELIILPLRDGPYLSYNPDPNWTLTPSGTEPGSMTLTASGPTFTALDIGRHVRLKHGSVWAWFTIGSLQSETIANVTSHGNTTATATSIWRLGAWYGKSWPVALHLYQGRLWGGGAPSDPARLFGSAMMEPNSFSIGDEVTDAVEFLFAGGDRQSVPLIRWISSTGKTLIVGTASGPWTVSSGSADTAAISLEQAVARPEESIGAEIWQPARVVGRHVVYTVRGGQKLGATGYRFDDDQWVVDDLNLFSEHICNSGIRTWATQQNPEQVIWVVLYSGILLSCTYNADQQVLAWARHLTDGAFESVEVIPGAVDDEVWVIVARYINGTLRRYIERMDPIRPPSWPSSDSFYVDSGLSYAGAPAANFSGLLHLAGKTVHILADGQVRAPQAVSGSGTLVIDPPASKVHIGLPYRMLIEPTDPDVGARDGSTQGRRRRIARLNLEVLASSNCLVGANEFNLMPMQGGPPPSWGGPSNLKTGEMRGHVPDGWSYRTGFVVVQELPLPFHLLSASVLLKVSEA